MEKQITKASISSCCPFNMYPLYSRSKIMSDNTMITVYPFDGSLYSFYESPYVYRIEPNSLETQGLMDLGKLGLISHSRYSLLSFPAKDQGFYRPW